MTLINHYIITIVTFSVTRDFYYHLYYVINYMHFIITLFFISLINEIDFHTIIPLLNCSKCLHYTVNNITERFTNEVFLLLNT